MFTTAAETRPRSQEASCGLSACEKARAANRWFDIKPPRHRAHSPIARGTLHRGLWEEASVDLQDHGRLQAEAGTCALDDAQVLGKLARGQGDILVCTGAQGGATVGGLRAREP